MCPYKSEHEPMKQPSCQIVALLMVKIITVISFIHLTTGCKQEHPSVPLHMQYSTDNKFVNKYHHSELVCIQIVSQPIPHNEQQKNPGCKPKYPRRNREAP